MITDTNVSMGELGDLNDFPIVGPIASSGLTVGSVAHSTYDLGSILLWIFAGMVLWNGAKIGFNNIRTDWRK